MSRQVPVIPTRNGFKRPRSRGSQSPTLADIAVERIAGQTFPFTYKFHFMTIFCNSGKLNHTRSHNSGKRLDYMSQKSSEIEDKLPTNSNISKGVTTCGLVKPSKHSQILSVDFILHLFLKGFISDNLAFKFFRMALKIATVIKHVLL